MQNLSKEAQTQVFKQKVWKTTTADGYFSDFVITRDGRCLYPGCIEKKRLDCSHFWPRGMKRTRFDPLNCIALCRDHHTVWEKRKNFEYKEFMLRLLGKEKYDALEKRARTMMKIRDAVIHWMDKHEKLNG